MSSPLNSLVAEKISNFFKIQLSPKLTNLSKSTPVLSLTTQFQIANKTVIKPLIHPIKLQTCR